MSGHAGRVLVVGGSPEVSSASTVRAATAGCDAAVAVDRGLDALLAAGVPCDLFCGDADSVSPRGAALVRDAEAAAARSGAASADSVPGRACAFEVERYDPHKDFTDLALALRAIRERWGTAPIRCTCVSGGRPDHALAVIGRLTGWPAPVEIVEDGFTGRVLRAGESWRVGKACPGACPSPVGARFSLVPVSPEAVVSEAGMRWDLDRARVSLLSDLGISNVVERRDAAVSCHEGAVACWLFL